ncbi:mitochondrial fission 1 protein A [Artemisia annua]|uniref:Mitochondrial fission 1 protein A n=1 Tax=Artemisia annua TaxID=35608 RepID=A0A2U1P1B8_ARTAN|nr:mitochondrial fission 1 protein A [Artemisia annua]
MQFFRLVCSFFTSDQLPWYSQSEIEDVEEAVAMYQTSGDSWERRMILLCALYRGLVHSRKPEDVQRGVNMLEKSIAGCDPNRVTENIYLLAVGYYRLGDFSRSMMHVEQLIQIDPGQEEIMILKKAVEDRLALVLAKDCMVKFCPIAVTIGLVACGFVSEFCRKG